MRWTLKKPELPNKVAVSGAANISMAELEVIWGVSAAEVADGLTKFSKTAQVFRDKRPEILETYTHQWVGFHDGGVVAAGKTRADVINALQSQGVRTSDTIVSFMERGSAEVVHTP